MMLCRHEYDVVDSDQVRRAKGILEISGEERLRIPTLTTTGVSRQNKYRRKCPEPWIYHGTRVRVTSWTEGVTM